MKHVKQKHQFTHQILSKKYNNVHSTHESFLREAIGHNKGTESNLIQSQGPT